MGEEDFGYYAQHIPACLFRLRVMNREKGITSGVHTPTFYVDESAIARGMGLMAWQGRGWSIEGEISSKLYELLKVNLTINTRPDLAIIRVYTGIPGYIQIKTIKIGYQIQFV